MNYTLIVRPDEFELIWRALGEAPAKHVFALMTALKAQVEAQEAVEAAGPTGPAAPVEPPSI